MFGNTTPQYLYELLNQHNLNETTMHEYDEDEDEAGRIIPIQNSYKATTLIGSILSVPYKEILVGIANYEQGKEPSIGQKVYFIDIKKKIMFYMYDDRGCIIFAKEKESLQNLYTKYNGWLVDYWREYFDKLYK